MTEYTLLAHVFVPFVFSSGLRLLPRVSSPALGPLVVAPPPPSCKTSDLPSLLIRLPEVNVCTRRLTTSREKKRPLFIYDCERVFMHKQQMACAVALIGQ